MRPSLAWRISSGQRIFVLLETKEMCTKEKTGVWKGSREYVLFFSPDLPENSILKASGKLGLHPCISEGKTGSGLE